MPQAAVSVQPRPSRKDHPCIPLFINWTGYLVCAAIAAVLSGAPVFLLLGLPSVGFVSMLGENIARGTRTWMLRPRSGLTGS
jgi:hypothetical protein